MHPRARSMRPERLSPSSEMLVKDNDDSGENSVQARIGGGCIEWCSASQTSAIIGIAWRTLTTPIARSHSRTSDLGAMSWGFKNLHFEQVQVTTMLLIQGPHLEKDLNR